jgi:hypothetical protein
LRRPKWDEHGGPYDQWRQTAYEFAWLIDQLT